MLPDISKSVLIIGNTIRMVIPVGIIYNVICNLFCNAGCVETQLSTTMTEKYCKHFVDTEHTMTMRICEVQQLLTIQKFEMEQLKMANTLMMYVDIDTELHDALYELTKNIECDICPLSTREELCANIELGCRWAMCISKRMERVRSLL